MKRSSMTKKVLVLMALVTMMLVLLVGCGKTDGTSTDNMQQFVDPNTGSNTQGDTTITEDVGVKTVLSRETASQILMDSIVNANAVIGDNRYITFSFAPYFELTKSGKTTRYSLSAKGSIDTEDNDNSVFIFEVLKNEGADDQVILGFYGVNGDIYIDFNDFDSGNAVHRYYVDDADIAYLATVLDKIMDQLQIEGILTDFNLGEVIGNSEVTSLLSRLNLKTDSLINLFFSLIADDGCYAITRSDGVMELVMPTKLNMVFQTPAIMSVLNTLVSDLLADQSSIIKGIVDFLAGDILSGAKVLDTYIVAEVKDSTFQKVALKIDSTKNNSTKNIELGAGSLAKTDTMSSAIKEEIENRVDIDIDRLPYSFTTLSADVDIELDLANNTFSMSQIDSAIGGALSGLLTGIDENVWTNEKFINIGAHKLALHVKLRAEIDMKNNDNTKILVEINGTENKTRIGLYYYGRTHAVYVDLEGIGGGKYMTDEIDGEPIDLNKLIAAGIEKLIPEIPSIMSLINGDGTGSATAETSEYGQAIISAIQAAQAENKLVVSHFGFAEADDAATTEESGDLDIMAILGCLSITMGDSTRFTIESITADLTQDVINSLLNAIGLNLPVDALSLSIKQGRDENNYEGWDVDLHLNLAKTNYVAIGADEDYTGTRYALSEGKYVASIDGTYKKVTKQIAGADVGIFLNYGNPDSTFAGTGWEKKTDYNELIKTTTFYKKVISQKNNFIDVNFLRKGDDGSFDNMWVNVSLGLRLNFGVDAGSDFDLSPLGQYILGLVIKLQGGNEGADVDLGIKIDAAVNIMTLINAINNGADVSTILSAINARIEIGRYIEGGNVVDTEENSLLIILQDGDIYLNSDNLGVKYMISLTDILGGDFSLFTYDADAEGSANSALVAEETESVTTESDDGDVDILSVVIAALEGIKLDNTALEVGIADNLLANLLKVLGIDGFSDGELAFSNDGTYIKLNYEGLNLSKLWLEANIGLQQEGTDSGLNLGLGLGAIKLGLGNVDYIAEEKFSDEEIAEFKSQNITKGGNIQLGVQLGIDLSLAKNDISLEETLGGLIADLELVTNLNVVDELRSGLIIDIFANVDISSEPDDNDSQILIEILRSSDYTALLGIYYDQATKTLYLDSDDAAIIQPVALKIDLISLIMGLIGDGSAAADIDLSNLNPILLIGDGGVQIKVLSGITELIMGLLVGDMVDCFEVSESDSKYYRYYQNENGLDASIVAKAQKDAQGNTVYYQKNVKKYTFNDEGAVETNASTGFFVKANDTDEYFLVNYNEWLKEVETYPVLKNYTLCNSTTGEPIHFITITNPVELTEENAERYKDVTHYIKVQYKLASTLCYNDLSSMEFIENGGFVSIYSTNGLPRYIRVEATDPEIQLYNLFSTYDESLGKYKTTKKVYDEEGNLVKEKEAYLKIPGLGAAICIGHYTNSSVSIVNPSQESAGLGIGIFVTDNDSKAPFEYVEIGEEELYEGTIYYLVDNEYVTTAPEFYDGKTYKFDCSNTLANIAIKLDIQLSDKRFAWIHNNLGLSEYIASVAKKFADNNYATADASNIGDLTVYLQVVLALDLGADDGEYVALTEEEKTTYTGKRYSYNAETEKYVENSAGTYKFVGVDWNIGSIVSALAGSTTGDTDALTTFLRSLLIKFNVLEDVSSTIGVRIAGNVKLGALLDGGDTATIISNLLCGSEIAVEITDGDPYDVNAKRVIALYVKDEMIYINLDGSLVTNTKLKLPVKQITGLIGGLLASDSAMSTEATASADLDVAGILGIINNCVKNISIYNNDTQSGLEINLSKNIVGAIIGLVAGVDGVTGLELNESNSYIKLNTNISNSNPYLLDVSLGLDPAVIGIKLGGLKLGLTASDDVFPETFDESEYKGFADFAENISLDLEIGVDLALYEGELDLGNIISKILQGMGTDIDFPLVIDIQDTLSLELRVQIAGNINLNDLDKTELKIAILNLARDTGSADDLPTTVFALYIAPEKNSEEEYKLDSNGNVISSLYIETNFATGADPKANATKDKVENFNLLDSLLGDSMQKLVAYLNTEVGGGESAMATGDPESANAAEILLELADGSLKLEIANELFNSLLVALIGDAADESVVKFIEDLEISAEAVINTSPDVGVEVRAECTYFDLGIMINKINLSLSKIETIFAGVTFADFEKAESTNDALSISLGLDIDYNFSNGVYNYDNILKQVAKADLFKDDATLTTIASILEAVSLDLITKNTKGTIGLDVTINLLSSEVKNALASVSVVLCDLIMGALDSSYIVSGEEMDVEDILRLVEAEIKIDINDNPLVISLVQEYDSKNVWQATWVCLNLKDVGGVPFKISLAQIMKTISGSSALATADTNELVSNILQQAFASISITSGTGLDIALQSTFAQFLMNGVLADLLGVEGGFNKELVAMFQLKAPYAAISDADDTTIAYDTNYYQKVTEIRYNNFNASFTSQQELKLYTSYVNNSTNKTEYVQIYTKDGHEEVYGSSYKSSTAYVYYDENEGKNVTLKADASLFVKKEYERYAAVKVYDSNDAETRNVAELTVGSAADKDVELYDENGNKLDNSKLYAKVYHSGIGWSKKDGLDLNFLFVTGEETKNPDFFLTLGIDATLEFSGSRANVLGTTTLSDYNSLSNVDNTDFGGEIFLSLTLSVGLTGSGNGVLDKATGEVTADSLTSFEKFTDADAIKKAVVTNTAYYTTDGGKSFTNNLFVKAEVGQTYYKLYTKGANGVYAEYTNDLYYATTTGDVTTYTNISTKDGEDDVFTIYDKMYNKVVGEDASVTYELVGDTFYYALADITGMTEVKAGDALGEFYKANAQSGKYTFVDSSALYYKDGENYKVIDKVYAEMYTKSGDEYVAFTDKLYTGFSVRVDSSVELYKLIRAEKDLATLISTVVGMLTDGTTLSDSDFEGLSAVGGLLLAIGEYEDRADIRITLGADIGELIEALTASDGISIATLLEGVELAIESLDARGAVKGGIYLYKSKLYIDYINDRDMYVLDVADLLSALGSSVADREVDPALLQVWIGEYITMGGTYSTGLGVKLASGLVEQLLSTLLFDGASLNLEEMLGGVEGEITVAFAKPEEGTVYLHNEVDDTYVELTEEVKESLYEDKEGSKVYEDYDPTYPEEVVKKYVKDGETYREQLYDIKLSDIEIGIAIGIGSVELGLSISDIEIGMISDDPAKGRLVVPEAVKNYVASENNILDLSLELDIGVEFMDQTDGKYDLGALLNTVLGSTMFEADAGTGETWLQLTIPNGGAFIDLQLAIAIAIDMVNIDNSVAAIELNARMWDGVATDYTTLLGIYYKDGEVLIDLSGLGFDNIKVTGLRLSSLLGSTKTMDVITGLLGSGSSESTALSTAATEYSIEYAGLISLNTNTIAIELSKKIVEWAISLSVLGLDESTQALINSLDISALLEVDYGAKYVAVDSTFDGTKWVLVDGRYVMYDETVDGTSVQLYQRVPNIAINVSAEAASLLGIDIAIKNIQIGNTTLHGKSIMDFFDEDIDSGKYAEFIELLFGKDDTGAISLLGFDPKLASLTLELDLDLSAIFTDGMFMNTGDVTYAGVVFPGASVGSIGSGSMGIRASIKLEIAVAELLNTIQAGFNTQDIYAAIQQVLPLLQAQISVYSVSDGDEIIGIYIYDGDVFLMLDDLGMPNVRLSSEFLMEIVGALISSDEGAALATEDSESDDTLTTIMSLLSTILDSVTVSNKALTIALTNDYFVELLDTLLYAGKEGYYEKVMPENGDGFTGVTLNFNNLKSTNENYLELATKEAPYILQVYYRDAANDIFVKYNKDTDGVKDALYYKTAAGTYVNIDDITSVDMDGEYYYNTYYQDGENGNLFIYSEKEHKASEMEDKSLYMRVTEGLLSIDLDAYATHLNVDLFLPRLGTQSGIISNPTESKYVGEDGEYYFVEFVPASDVTAVAFAIKAELEIGENEGGTALANILSGVVGDLETVLIIEDNITLDIEIAAGAKFKYDISAGSFAINELNLKIGIKRYFEELEATQPNYPFVDIVNIYYINDDSALYIDLSYFFQKQEDGTKNLGLLKVTNIDLVGLLSDLLGGLLASAEDTTAVATASDTSVWADADHMNMYVEATATNTASPARYLYVNVLDEDGNYSQSYNLFKGTLADDTKIESNVYKVKTSGATLYVRDRTSASGYTELTTTNVSENQFKAKYTHDYDYEYRLVSNLYYESSTGVYTRCTDGTNYSGKALYTKVTDTNEVDHYYKVTDNLTYNEYYRSYNSTTCSYKYIAYLKYTAPTRYRKDANGQYIANNVAGYPSTGTEYIKAPITSLSMVWADFTANNKSYVEASDGEYVLINGSYVPYVEAEHATLTRYNKVQTAYFDVGGLIKVNVTGKAMLGVISSLVDNSTLNSILDEAMVSFHATRDPFIFGLDLSILDKYNNYDPALVISLNLMGFDFTGDDEAFGSYLDFEYNDHSIATKIPSLKASEKAKYRTLASLDLDKILNAYDVMDVLMDAIDLGDEEKLYLNMSVDLETFAKNFGGSIQSWSDRFADLLGLDAGSMNVFYTTMFDNIGGDGNFSIDIVAAIDIQNLIGGLLNGSGLNLEGTEIQITIDMDTMLFSEQLRAEGSKIVITAVGEEDGLLTLYIDFSAYRGKSKHKITLNIGDLLGGLGISAFASADVDTGIIPENIFGILNAVLGEVRLGNGRIYVGLKNNVVGSLLNALLGTNIQETESLISGGVYIDIRNLEIGIDVFLGEHSDYVEATDGAYVLVDGEYVLYDAENSAHATLDRYNYVKVDGYNYSSEDEFYMGIIIGGITLLAPDAYNKSAGTFVTDKNTYKDIKELQLDIDLEADVFYKGDTSSSGLDISPLLDLVGTLLGQDNLFGTKAMKMLVKEDGLNATYTLKLNAHLDLANWNNMRVVVELWRNAKEGTTTYNELRLGVYLDGNNIYVDLSSWGIPKIKITNLNLGDTLDDLIGGLLDGIIVSDTAMASSANYVTDYADKTVYVRAEEGEYVIVDGKYVAYTSEYEGLARYTKKTMSFRDSWGDAIFPTTADKPYISLVLGENHFGFGINADLLNGLLATIADGLGMAIELPDLGDMALLFDARLPLTEGDDYADTQITAVMQIDSGLYAGLAFNGLSITGYATNSNAVDTFTSKIGDGSGFIEAYNIATGEIGLERISIGTTITIEQTSVNTSNSTFEKYLGVLVDSLLGTTGLSTTINLPTSYKALSASEASTYAGTKYVLIDDVYTEYDANNADHAGKTLYKNDIVIGCTVELRAALNLQSLLSALQGGVSDWWNDVELYLAINPRDYGTLLKLYKVAGDDDVYADLTGLNLFKVKIIGLGGLLGGLLAGDASSALSTVAGSSAKAQSDDDLSLAISLGQTGINIDIGMDIIDGILGLLGDTLTIEPASTTDGGTSLTDYDRIVIGEGADATVIPIPVLSSSKALSVALKYPSVNRNPAVPLELSIGLGFDDNNSLNIKVGNVAIGVGDTATSNHVRYGATNGVINTSGTNVMGDISGENAYSYSGLVLNDAYGISLTNILTAVIKGIDPYITIDWYKATNHVTKSDGTRADTTETRTNILLQRTTQDSKTSGKKDAYAGKVYAKIDTYTDASSSTVSRSVGAWLFNNYLYVDLGTVLSIDISLIEAVTKLQITELDILGLLNGDGLALSTSEEETEALATEAVAAEEEESSGLSLDIGSLIKGIEINWWYNTSVENFAYGDEQISTIRIELNPRGINNLLASVYYLLYGLYYKQINGTEAPSADLFDEDGLYKMVYEKDTTVYGKDGVTAYTSVGAWDYCTYYLQSFAASFVDETLGLNIPLISIEDLLGPSNSTTGAVLKQILGALLPLPMLVEDDANVHSYLEIVLDKSRLDGTKGVLSQIGLYINTYGTEINGTVYERSECTYNSTDKYGQAEVFIRLNNAVKLNAVSSVKTYTAMGTAGTAIEEKTMSTQTIMVEDPFDPVELSASALTESLNLKKVEALFYNNSQYTSKSDTRSIDSDDYSWAELGGTPIVWDTSKVNLTPGATSYVYGYALNYCVQTVTVKVSAMTEFMKLYGYFVDDGVTFVESSKITVDPTKTPGDALSKTAAGLPSMIVIMRKDGELQVLSTEYDSTVEKTVTIGANTYKVVGKFGWIEPSDEEIEAGGTIDVKFWYQIGYSSRIQKSVRVKYDNGSVESAVLPTGDKFDILTSGTALDFTADNIDILGNLGLPAISASNTFTAIKDADNNDCFKYIGSDDSVYYFYVGTAPTDAEALAEWNKHAIGENGTFKRYFNGNLLTEGSYEYVAAETAEAGLLDSILGIFSSSDDTETDAGSYKLSYSGWVDEITVQLANGNTSEVEVLEWKYDDFTFSMSNPSEGAKGTIVAVINKYVVDSESTTGYTNEKQELEIEINVTMQQLNELSDGDIRFNQYNDMFVEDTNGDYVFKTIENVFVLDETGTYALVDGEYILVEGNESLIDEDNTDRYAVGSVTGYVIATAADVDLPRYSINIFGSDEIEVRVKQSSLKSTSEEFEIDDFVFYTGKYVSSDDQTVSTYIFEVPELTVTTERNIDVTALYNVNDTYEQTFGITVAISSKVADKVVLITKVGENVTSLVGKSVTVYYKDGTSTTGLAEKLLDLSKSATVIPDNATKYTGITNGKTTLFKADDDNFTQKNVTLEIRVF